MGILLALWILARFILSNVLVDFADVSASPMIGNADIRNVSRVVDVGKSNIAEIHSPIAAVVPDIMGDPRDMMALSSPMYGLVERTPADLHDSPRYRELLVEEPDFAAYRLSPAGLSERAATISENTEFHPSASENDAGEQHRKRFGGYFWVFTRQAQQALGSDSSRSGPTVSNGQYGGSQMGAILSYPILSKAGSDLTVYGRLTAALSPFAQEEVAVGVRIRPVAKVPLSIHAEQRLSADTGGDRGTAFYLAGGTGPDHIVGKIAIETYAQAGYILGDHETYFFDASATFQRPITEIDQKELSVGAGVWAGGQSNITRLDVGPRADFRVPLGTTTARISVDWRVRVAGAARPKSGAAITVSTGF